MYFAGSLYTICIYEEKIKHKVPSDKEEVKNIRENTTCINKSCRKRQDKNMYCLHYALMTVLDGG